MELFLQFNRQKLTFSAVFWINLWNFEQILLWLLDFDLAGLLEDFFNSFMSTIIQIFQKLILKKIETIWCLSLTGRILEI